MHRIGRFGIWIAVVGVCLLAPLWLSIGGRWGSAAGLVQSGLGLGAMLWLLITTPADAIKLPGWLSAAVIPLGALGLSAIARQDWPLPPGGCALCLGLAIAALLAIEYPDLGRVRAADAPRRKRLFSSWWLALALWHPSLWVVDVLSLPSNDSRRGLAMLGFALAALVVLVPSVGARRVGVIGWVMSWGVVVVITV